MHLILQFRNKAACVSVNANGSGTSLKNVYLSKIGVKVNYSNQGPNRKGSVKSAPRYYNGEIIKEGSPVGGLNSKKNKSTQPVLSTVFTKGVVKKNHPYKLSKDSNKNRVPGGPKKSIIATNTSTKKQYPINKTNNKAEPSYYNIKSYGGNPWFKKSLPEKKAGTKIRSIKRPTPWLTEYQINTNNKQAQLAYSTAQSKKIKTYKGSNPSIQKKIRGYLPNLYPTLRSDQASAPHRWGKGKKKIFSFINPQKKPNLCPARSAQRGNILKIARHGLRGGRIGVPGLSKFKKLLSAARTEPVKNLAYKKQVEGFPSGSQRTIMSRLIEIRNSKLFSKYYSKNFMGMPLTKKEYYQLREVKLITSDSKYNLNYKEKKDIVFKKADKLNSHTAGETSGERTPSKVSRPHSEAGEAGPAENKSSIARSAALRALNLNFITAYKKYLFNTNRNLFYKEFFTLGKLKAMLKEKIRKQITDSLVLSLKKEYASVVDVLFYKNINNTNIKLKNHAGSFPVAKTVVKELNPFIFIYNAQRAALRAAYASNLEGEIKQSRGANSTDRGPVYVRLVASQREGGNNKKSTISPLNLNSDTALRALILNKSYVNKFFLTKFYINKPFKVIENNIFWGSLDGTVTLPLIVRLYQYIEKRSIILKKNRLREIKNIYKLASTHPYLYSKLIPNFRIRKPVFKLLNKPNFLPQFVPTYTLSGVPYSAYNRSTSFLNKARSDALGADNVNKDKALSSFTHLLNSETSDSSHFNLNPEKLSLAFLRGAYGTIHLRSTSENIDLKKNPVFSLPNPHNLEFSGKNFKLSGFTKILNGGVANFQGNLQGSGVRQPASQQAGSVISEVGVLPVKKKTKKKPGFYKEELEFIKSLKNKLTDRFVDSFQRYDLYHK